MISAIFQLPLLRFALATFWDVHGVQAAQQVSDVQVVPLLPTHPVVAGEIEAQVRPVHVGHHHPVQEPAGIHPRVVVLDPAGTTEAEISVSSLNKQLQGQIFPFHSASVLIAQQQMGT